MALRKILCIDDQAIVHKMYESVLAPYIGQGSTLLHANNGWEGLKVLVDHSDTDLVLLDLGMPIMNGLVFLEQKQRTPFAPIPVVVVSAWANEAEDVQRALSLGARAVLPKPFTFQDIEAKVAEIFGGG